MMKAIKEGSLSISYEQAKNKFAKNLNVTVSQVSIDRVDKQIKSLEESKFLYNDILGSRMGIYNIKTTSKLSDMIYSLPSSFGWVFSLIQDGKTGKQIISSLKNKDIKSLNPISFDEVNRMMVAKLIDEKGSSDKNIAKILSSNKTNSYQQLLV